jgi:hypothetical protein
MGKSSIENWEKPDGLKAHQEAEIVKYLVFCSKPPEEIGVVQTAYTNSTRATGSGYGDEQKQLNPFAIFGIVAVILIPLSFLILESLSLSPSVKIIGSICIAAGVAIFTHKEQSDPISATFVGEFGAGVCVYQPRKKVKQVKEFVLFANIASFNETKTNTEFIVSFLNADSNVIFEIRGSNAVDSRTGQEARAFANALLGAWENSRRLKNQAA